MVNKEIKEYIENEILPKYAALAGHTGEHIEEVILRSLEFAKQAPEAKVDMVYVIAAYHDLGRLVDNETHNIESAKMLLADKFLSSRFSPEEMKVMAEAVEDHRASLGREPRSVYGRIVSSADRNPNFESMLGRCFDYNRMLYPENSVLETVEEERQIIRRKYSPDGYAAKTMYFRDPSFEKMLVEVEEKTRTSERFLEVMKEYFKKVGRGELEECE
ncbi:HD domain-containing protein [Candidatus Saccharibacteria bacterium]|nr:HD domain-containing protein [Candidatus Saccharibacteria bacterium]